MRRVSRTRAVIPGSTGAPSDRRWDKLQDTRCVVRRLTASTIPDVQQDEQDNTKEPTRSRGQLHFTRGETRRGEGKGVIASLCR